LRQALVVDTSVAIKWLLAEEYSAHATALVNAGWALHAPDIMLLEVDNVLCRRARVLDFDPAVVGSLRRTMRAVDVTYHGFRDLLDGGVGISMALDHAVYDCLFLALGGSMNARVVTADKELLRRVRGTVWEPAALWIGDLAR